MGCGSSTPGTASDHSPQLARQGPPQRLVTFDDLQHNQNVTSVSTPGVSALDDFKWFCNETDMLTQDVMPDVAEALMTVPYVGAIFGLARAVCNKAALVKENDDISKRLRERVLDVGQLLADALVSPKSQFKEMVDDESIEMKSALEKLMEALSNANAFLAEYGEKGVLKRGLLTTMHQSKLKDMDQSIIAAMDIITYYVTYLSAAWGKQEPINFNLLSSKVDQLGDGHNDRNYTLSVSGGFSLRVS